MGGGHTCHFVHGDGAVGDGDRAEDDAQAVVTGGLLAGILGEVGIRGYIRGTGILVRERSSELLHCRGGIVSWSGGA